MTFRHFSTLDTCRVGIDYIFIYETICSQVYNLIENAIEILLYFLCFIFDVAGIIRLRRVATLAKQDKNDGVYRVQVGLASFKNEQVFCVTYIVIFLRLKNFFNRTFQI